MTEQEGCHVLVTVKHTFRVASWLEISTLARFLSGFPSPSSWFSRTSADQESNINISLIHICGV